MNRRLASRTWYEPTGLFVVALLGSALVWGRLFFTDPTTRGLCGCGDPSLFQWFLAWPAHAMTTGHSLVFSRDLFHPAGINLLANTSVLGLGVPLAPVTWLGGPVLTQNVALLLAIPIAVWTMDLFLRRVTTSMLARVVLSLLYGFSPYVMSSLIVSHLMTAWIGLLPLIALGVLDAASEDASRSRRGKVLLGIALVGQFFISTELLLLAVIVAGLVLGVLGVTALVQRSVPAQSLVIARRLLVPVVIAAAIVIVPASYALAGPRSIKGNIWGPGFNPATGGTSLADLLRPHAVSGGLNALSGYLGPAMVQMQYLGYAFVLAVLVLGALRWRDGVSRTAAIVTVLCLVLSLSPGAKWTSWAPWQWIGKLPILGNVLQFRITVFALLAGTVVIARGVAEIERLGRVGFVTSGVVLAIVVVPVAIPVAQGLPIRTVHVAIPTWWRTTQGGGVVLAYPYPSTILQGPLTWQSHGGFAVSMLGGSGPQGTLSRAGVDAKATVVLNQLSKFERLRPTANPENASLVRAMIERDGVTEVVVPVTIRGRFLATGQPSPAAAVFFTEILGQAPTVSDDAWVFRIHVPLPAPHFVSDAAAARCEGAAALAGPAALATCFNSIQRDLP